MVLPTDQRARDQLTWEVELDRLELELIRVERLLKAMSPLQQPDWVQPSTMPPLPADLLPRAEDVARRQQEAQRELLRALARTGRQRDLADRVVPAGDDGRPRYVDLSA